jgi:predicted porin
MKKTIIAAAVAAAVAAPAAFADINISGMVNPEFTNQDDSKDTGYAASAVNTDLVFTGSEDLGNGMTASFKYHMYHDSGADSVADTTASLSGDFGTVTAGRMESFHESVAQGFTNIDASHDADLEHGLSANNIGDRVNSALAYMTPNMSGFSAGVALIQGAGEDSDSFASATDFLVKYSNAGLTVFANRFSVDGATLMSGEEITGAQSLAVSDFLTDGNLLVTVAGDASFTAKADVTADAIGASYTMGGLELRAMHRTLDIGSINTLAVAQNGVEFEETLDGGEIDSTFFGAKYTMGANTFAIGNIDDDVEGESTIYSLSHALSKRTSVYITHNDVDSQAGLYNGLLNKASKQADRTVIGLKHTF